MPTSKKVTTMKKPIPKVGAKVVAMPSAPMPAAAIAHVSNVIPMPKKPVAKKPAAKTVAAKPVAAKAAVKKPVVKASVKKPVAKKPVAKKPVAKAPIKMKVAAASVRPAKKVARKKK